jgi:hypothetical protein
MILSQISTEYKMGSFFGKIVNINKNLDVWLVKLLSRVNFMRYLKIEERITLMLVWVVVIH